MWIRHKHLQTRLLFCNCAFNVFSLAVMMATQLLQTSFPRAWWLKLCNISFPNCFEPNCLSQRLHAYRLTSWGVQPLARQTLQTKAEPCCCALLRSFADHYVFGYRVLQASHLIFSLHSRHRRVFERLSRLALLKSFLSNFECPHGVLQSLQVYLVTSCGVQPSVVQAAQMSLHLKRL